MLFATLARRRCRLLVLCCLLCSLGAALATPLLRPRALALVCTASGVVWVSPDAAASPAPGMAAGLECADCLPTALPPPLASEPAAVHGVTNRPVTGTDRAVTLRTLAAPLARGPPPRF